MAKIIGFIGLGIMGKPMARNLLKGGYALTVYNRSQPAMDELKLDGATLGSSPKDVAARSEVVITMLPNSPDVEAVVLGVNGVLEGAKAGTILVDMSTISPLVSQHIYGEAKIKAARRKKRTSRPWMLQSAGARRGPSGESSPLWPGGIKRSLRRSSPSSRPWEKRLPTWDQREQAGLQNWPIR
jgi:hypothetical protein